MKKFLIILITLSIILLIGQNIYYNTNKKENIVIASNNTSTENHTILTDENGNDIDIDAPTKTIYARGTTTIYKSYNGLVPMEKLQSELYIFLYDVIPQIRNLTQSKTTEQISKIYYENQDTFNQMQIYSEEDFEYIATELESIGYDRSTYIYSYAEADTDSYITLSDNYIQFNVTINFKNNAKIYFTIKLSTNGNNTKSIKYCAYDVLSLVYKKYKGQVEENHLKTAIQTLINSVESIYGATTGISNNKRLQYFDLHKDDVKSIGIYSNEDFLKVSNQVNNMDWTNNLKFVSYSVDLSNYKEENGYASFILKLNYDNNQSMSVILYLAQNITTDPNIKISAQ